MAEAKRRTTTAKKNTTASRNSAARSTSKRTSSAGQTRSTSRSSEKRSVNDSPKTTTSRRKSKPIKAETKEEILIFLLFAFFVFVLLCMINVVKGFVGTGVKSLMLGIFGLLGYFVPSSLLVGTLFKMSNKRNPIATIKLISAFTFVIVVGILICQISGLNVSAVSESNNLIKDLYDSKEKGGIIFGLLAVLLFRLLGNAGTWFICIVLGIICILLISEKQFLKRIFYRHNPFNTDEDYEEEEYEEENDGQYNLNKDRKANVYLASDDNDNQLLLLEKKHNAELKKQKEIEKEKRLEDKQKLIEEKKRQAEEKERIKDLKDDERILNTTIKGPSSSYNLIGVDLSVPLIEEKKKFSKDDIHEITIDVSEYQDKADDISELKTEDNININRLDDKADDSSEKIDNDYNLEKMIISNIENGENDEFTEKSVNDSSSEISNANTMLSDDEILNSSNITPSEPVKDDDVNSMPDPVTEKSHVGNEKPVEKPKPKPKAYKFPTFDLLTLNKNKNKGDSDEELKATALKLQNTLKTFGVGVKVSDISQGPSVTRYELTLDEGTKVSKIVGLQDDIKLNLAAQDIRIEAPIPGKAAVGIEIPNKETSAVLIRDILETKEFDKAESKITFAVGKDISGKTIVADIAKMPHMLIAGSTGAGKSVCINTLIMSILYKADPKDVKLIMIDPKVVELSVYNGIPHLLLPVVTDPRKASAALQWAVNEMTKRYNAFATYNVRDLKGYNQKISELYKKGETEELPKPNIVVIVDELADLMMVASKEVEESICRLAQLARAAGIHLIIATQRPSVDVITGLIKANMPSRVAFRVSSGVDSRTILDMVGAEKLLGKGDMLFYPQGYSKPLRTQGAFVSDEEVSNVVEFLKSNAGDNVYDEEVEAQIAGMSSSSNSSSGSTAEKASDIDPYFEEACRLVVEREKASSGMLQRVYKIGFNRAARIIDQMESLGVVGPEEGTKPRKVLMSISELEDLLESIY